MRITLNWLREFVDVVLPADELAEALVMAGIEVEAIDERRPVWRAVAIAEIAAVAPHPNADRLQLCEVRTAQGPVRVVCGARNMQAGDRVALAAPGAELPGGRRIERTTIRGQSSEGMLCSAAELGLPTDTDGIMILPADAPLGASLVEYLAADDTVLELAITPNRGDCLSVLGVAREIAALTGARLHTRPTCFTQADPTAKTLATVAVEAPDLCPRYCARVVRALRITPSPPWLRTRLEMVGLRPINNVVDVTNYVMLERGQPLHAFDLAHVADGRITVRRAGGRQRFTTLDGIERELLPDDLVIADGQQPIALAGIMGGANSEIRASTSDILLESAFFTPATVRRTSRRLGVSSESSYRFERGVDPSGTATALDRAVELVTAAAGGVVARGVLERRAPQHRPATIRLRPARLNAILGTRLTAVEIERPLRALGATVAGSPRTALRVVPPAHRFDLQSEIDLVEEVARLSGYESISATTPSVRLTGSGSSVHREVEESARQALRAAGFTETVSLALISGEENRTFPGLPEWTGDAVPLVNPPSVEASELRRSLLPGLLHALDENLRQNETFFAGLTFGRTYTREDARYHERPALALLLAGQWPPATLGEPVRAATFTDLKGTIELALDRLRIERPRWEPVGNEAPHLHPGKAARILCGSVLCGVAGALHPELAAAHRLDGDIWLAELDMLRVVQYCPRRVNFRPLPRFPAVQRDIAVVVDNEFQAQQVLDAIGEVAEPLVEEVHVFDHYAGAPIPDGRKSLAYSISYRAPDRTLTDAEVNALHEEIVARLLQQLPLEVRR